MVQNEMVNGPAHYGGVDNPYEVIKVCEAWGLESMLQELVRKMIQKNLKI